MKTSADPILSAYTTLLGTAALGIVDDPQEAQS